MKPLIVLVDDEEVAYCHYDSLLQDVFSVHWLGHRDLEAVVARGPDLFMINVPVNGFDGFEFARRLRSHPDFNGAPIVFTCEVATENVMDCVFAQSGDDLLIPRMGRVEILVRLQSKISLWRENRSLFRFGALKLDLKNLRAELGDSSLDLTLTEFKILKKLLRDHPRHVSREALTEFVWHGQVVMKGTLNTHLTNLRKKTRGWEFEITHSRPWGVCVQERVLAKTSLLPGSSPVA